MVAGQRIRTIDRTAKKTSLIDTSQRRRHRRSVATRHLFVCTNTRSSGKPACGVGGNTELYAEVQRLLIERNATDVLVTPCGCLGPCFDGPTAVVYPDGVWYGSLAADDAVGLVDHLIEGKSLARKIYEPPGSVS
jgi:(2Fe-2S) ferredoxin